MIVLLSLPFPYRTSKSFPWHGNDFALNCVFEAGHADLKITCARFVSSHLEIESPGR